jgi:UPF0176 protein
MNKVLLFYKFINIENPEELREKQLELCKKLGLKGRILISEEGINGTIGGSKETCDLYIQETIKYPGFEDIEWKISDSVIEPFPRLRVVVRDEIVTFKKGVDISKAAPYIDGNELDNLYSSDDNFVIIDGRNEYEARIGKFKNAIVPDIEAFRDFPEWFEANRSQFEGKKIVTYCTGGIRCEKLSAYLVEKGLKDVYQLHGGIHKYGEETGGKNFDGTMYVFDNRIHVNVNTVDPTIISECEHCGVKVARYINCCNAECNRQFICCEDCDVAFESGCCEDCKLKSRFNK